MCIILFPSHDRGGDVKDMYLDAKNHVTELAQVLEEYTGENPEEED